MITVVLVRHGAVGDNEGLHYFQHFTDLLQETAKGGVPDSNINRSLFLFTDNHPLLNR